VPAPESAAGSQNFAELRNGGFGMAVKVRRNAGIRPWLVGLGGVLVLVLVGWTIFWNFAAHEAAASLDAWIAREKLFRRVWTCPDRQIGGYPAAIEISCAKPKFDGMIFGEHYLGSLAGFVATAQFSNPDDVTINVVPPFHAEPDDRSGNLEMSWDALAVRLGGIPQNVSEVSVSGTGIVVAGKTSQLQAMTMKAQHAHAVFTRDAGRQDRATHFQIDLQGTSIPAVDAYLGGSFPADVTASGDITEASFNPAKTVAQTLSQWSAAGGRIELSNFAATRGETKLEAHGTLGIDSAHEVQGQLDTKCVGFEQVLLKLGVDPAIVSAGSLLAALLNGSKDNKGPQPLHLPVTFTEGRVSIGPVQTSLRVPPLY
jgi:hypothetical protein